MKQVREIITWISKGKVFQGGEEQVQRSWGGKKKGHLCIWRILDNEAREINKGEIGWWGWGALMGCYRDLGFFSEMGSHRLWIDETHGLTYVLQDPPGCLVEDRRKVGNSCSRGTSYKPIEANERWLGLLEESLKWNSIGRWMNSFCSSCARCLHSRGHRFSCLGQCKHSTTFLGQWKSGVWVTQRLKMRNVRT